MRLLLAGLLIVLAAAPARPEDSAVFRARCGSCHGQTGRADSMEARALKVPPLRDYKRLRGMKPAEIVALVRRNAKHASVMDVSDADLLAAAGYVTQLVHEEP